MCTSKPKDTKTQNKHKPKARFYHLVRHQVLKQIKLILTAPGPHGADNIATDDTYS